MEDAQAARRGTSGRELKSRGEAGFWVTEFAWDTSPPDPKGVPEELHARWVAEALYRMWAQGVSLVTWFLLRDQSCATCPFQSGLYFRGEDGISSDTPKLALTAFRFPFVAFREPSKRSVMFWGRSPAKRAPVVVEQKTGGSWHSWTRFGRTATASLPGSFRAAPSRFLRARLANGKDALSRSRSLFRRTARVVHGAPARARCFPYERRTSQEPFASACWKKERRSPKDGPVVTPPRLRSLAGVRGARAGRASRPSRCGAVRIHRLPADNRLTTPAAKPGGYWLSGSSACEVVGAR